MKKILTDEELLDVQEKYDDNLSEFKKKFILFFIGLCCFAVSIIITAFGSMVGSIGLFIGVAVWAAPLVIKFWFSGFGSLFDFQYKTYEIDSYGNMRDVSKIDSIMVGPILKCFAAMLVVIAAIYIVPAEIIIRFFNHIRFEKKLGLKGAITEAPRKEAALAAIVVVAMIVIATIGNAIATIAENTSDIGNEQIIELIEKIEAKKSYTILGYLNYARETNPTYAEGTESSDGVTVNVLRSFYVSSYELPTGTYEYKNGSWGNVSEEIATALTRCTLGLNFDFATMKANTNKIVVNKDNGLGGRLDTETHDYYEIDCKDNSDLEFNYIYVEADFKFIESYSLIYVFD